MAELGEALAELRTTPAPPVVGVDPALAGALHGTGHGQILPGGATHGADAAALCNTPVCRSARRPVLPGGFVRDALEGALVFNPLRRLARPAELDTPNVGARIIVFI